MPKMLLALVGAVALSSCATKQQPQLFSEQQNKRDSALPWTEQKKWETQGQFGPMAERMGGQGNH
ncbi:MAG TPA: hypothetical protein VM937_05965 [Burkholderiaceae bacterium]|nr:hypothetical protein [Burkholderiaceae bacterium]